MHSCIYEGRVSHFRHHPVTHRFQYRLFMVCLDLAELPGLVGRRGIISENRWAPRSFVRRDHLFDPARSLDAEVRDIVLRETGEWPEGPVRLLTQLRYCGVYFSPLNLFYVYDRRGDRVEYVVAEVNNTPWHERHCYVLWDGNRTGESDSMRFAHAKSFHVSPFMGMSMDYHWQLGVPGERSVVRLRNVQAGSLFFDARMVLRRRQLNRASLRQMTMRYPLMTTKICAAIYYQAWKLWWKKCPFYTHPAKSARLALPGHERSDQRLDQAKTFVP